MISKQYQLSDSSAVSYVLERVKPDGTNADRRPLEEQWFGDMAYLYGRPWFVPEGGFIRPPRDPRFIKKKYNANLILPKVMKSLAKISGINAQLVPLPMSPDRRDLQAARLAKQVHAHLQEATKLRTKLRRVMLWAASCGSGFLRVSWDSRQGTASRIYLDSAGNPDILALYDDERRMKAEEAGNYTDVYPGEIRLDVTDPFQTWWDPNARGGGVSEARWMATNIARPVDTIKDAWGEDVSPEPADLRGVEVYRDILAFIAGDDFRGIGIKTPNNELARETEYFEIPMQSNGMQGRHIVICGGRAIRNGPNPYGWLPFVKFDWFPTEGRFPGLSLVNQMRNSQKARNEAREHMHRFMKTSGYAPIILPRGSGIKPVQIAALHGLILEADMNGPPPIFGQAPQLPPYIAQLVADPEAEMDKISAQSDPTNNKLPGQLRSGVAVAAIQADNNAILTPTSEALLDSLSDLGTKMLELVGKHYTQPRMIQVVGPDGAVEVRKFIGSDLRNHFRLHISAQPGILDSQESRQAKMYEAVQLGILNMQNPDEKVLALRALQYNTSDDFMSALLQQEQGEWREIDRMIEDPMYFPNPQPWNDPAARARVLERFLNSPEFEQIDAVAQKKCQLRWQAFSQIMAERMQQQMAMMEQSKGAPGQKGQASQPRS